MVIGGIHSRHSSQLNLLELLESKNIIGGGTQKYERQVLTSLDTPLIGLTACHNTNAGT